MSFSPDVTSNEEFSTTVWTMVAHAGGDTPECRAALEKLCRSYWRPIYAWLRRTGNSPADAEDLTQGFLSAFIQRQSFQTATPLRGRFRSYLLGSLTNYVADQRDRAQAQKRGGGRTLLPLHESAEVESAYASDFTSTADTPDRHFDRHFAESLFARARMRLRAECAARGKLAHYEAFGPEASHGARSGLQRRGESLGLSGVAARYVALRLRQRYKKLIEEEVRSIVDSDEEVTPERRQLVEALR